MSLAPTDKPRPGGPETPPSVLHIIRQDSDGNTHKVALRLLHPQEAALEKENPVLLSDSSSPHRVYVSRAQALSLLGSEYHEGMSEKEIAERILAMVHPEGEDVPKGSLRRVPSPTESGVSRSSPSVVVRSPEGHERTPPSSPLLVRRAPLEQTSPSVVRIPGSGNTASPPSSPAMTRPISFWQGVFNRFIPRVSSPPLPDMKPWEKYDVIQLRSTDQLLGQGSFKKVQLVQALFWDRVAKTFQQQARSIALTEMRPQMSEDVQEEIQRDFEHELEMHRRVQAAFPPVRHFLRMWEAKVYGPQGVTPCPRGWMEPCNGGNLEQFLRSHPELSSEERCRLCREILESVMDLHRLNLCHLDLKPANIMLQSDEKGIWHVKVGDCGLMQEMNAMVSMRGSIVAPEMVQANKKKEDTPVTPALDQYALGAILFSVLTGLNPFESLSSRQQMVYPTSSTYVQEAELISEKMKKLSALYPEDPLAQDIAGLMSFDSKASQQVRPHLHDVYEHLKASHHEFHVQALKGELVSAPSIS